MKYYKHTNKLLLIVSSVFILNACLAAAPTILGTIAKTFGANLLTTATQNYSPEYGKDLEDLLMAMVTSVSDNGKTQQNYARDNNTEYQEYQPERDVAYQQEYQQEYQPEGDAAYQQEYQPEYQQEAETAYRPEIAKVAYVNKQWAKAELAMNVDVLVQRAGDSGDLPPTPIRDGEVLFGHPSDPTKGDKIKVSFNANCDCYLYIVGIDSTGYMVQIFPDPQSGMTNPIRRNTDYLVPGGNEWYGLDNYKGTEEVYFIASKNRRLDLERIIKKMSNQKRNIGSDYKAVRVAAILPRTRGLVKITSPRQSFVQSTSGQSHAFSPTLFISNAKNSDLAITRWFKHQ